MRDVDKSDKSPVPFRTPQVGSPSRRNVLLAGTTIAAATALGPANPAALAQAQQPSPAPRAPAASSTPNILVIYGDDIGITNISA